MKKIIFVAFGLLLSTPCFADSMNDSLDRIETEWSNAGNTGSVKMQKEKFQRLYNRVTKLASEHPDKAEPKIVQALILLTIAQIEGAFSALSLVHQAKELLLGAISINPDARNGSAVFTLGILYYKVPGWPIGFGDDDKAEKLLLSSVSKNPEGIGSNYYYGDFLIQQDRPDEAERYLKRAAQAYLPPNEPFKLEMKKKASAALAGLI
jgi:tetratricopeptide (TPR) repeat protein